MQIMCTTWRVGCAAHFICAALDDLLGLFCQAVQSLGVNPRYWSACPGLGCLRNALKYKWLHQQNDSRNAVCRYAYNPSTRKTLSEGAWLLLGQDQQSGVHAMHSRHQ